MIKTKFKCDSVTHFSWAKQAELSVVTTGSEENKTFAKFTPSGRLTILIDNEAPASDFFEPNKEYYLTFEKT